MSQQPGILSGCRDRRLCNNREHSGTGAGGKRRLTPAKWQNLPALKPAPGSGCHRCSSRSSRLASICSTAAAASP